MPFEYTDKGNCLIGSTEDTRIVRFPHPSKLSVNYDNLKAGDIFLTTSVAFIADCIKLVTFGIDKTLSLKVPNHCGIITKIQDQFFICEALSDGFHISSLYEYLDPKLTNFYEQVCSIKRHPKMTDDHRVEINRQCLTLAADFPKYNFKGLFSFLNPWRKPENVPSFLSGKERALFCSEAASFICRECDPVLDLCPSKVDSSTAPSDIFQSPILDEKYGEIIINKK